VPYVKAIWRPDPSAEFEFRVTGLQNGLFVRWFLAEDRSSQFDFTMAYETLMFRLADGSYGGRAVAIGEVPLRVGLTQFLESPVWSSDMRAILALHQDAGALMPPVCKFVGSRRILSHFGA
jgi:hypothetical protein